MEWPIFFNYEWKFLEIIFTSKSLERKKINFFSVSLAILRILSIQYLLTYIVADIYWHNLYFLCIFIIILILKPINCLFLRFLCCFLLINPICPIKYCFGTALGTDKRRSDSNKDLCLSNFHMTLPWHILDFCF